MLRTLLKYLIVFGLSLTITTATAQTQSTTSFIVITHATTPVNSVTRSTLSDLFLKRLRTWSNSRVVVVPVNQARRSQIREVFTRTIHRTTVAEIETYWQQQIFSGRNTPPFVKNSDTAIVEFVRTNPGAIGYVRVGTPLGHDVKVLTII